MRTTAGVEANDLRIGAWCIRNGCDLIQNDREDDGMVSFMGLRGAA